jgi:hypothetical protein
MPAEEMWNYSDLPVDFYADKQEIFHLIRDKHPEIWQCFHVVDPLQ